MPAVRSAVLSPSEVRAFRSTVLGHFRKHGRDLPWRHTRDPYHIYVSEVMLQQTQVDRVAVKYQQFIAAFPDWRSLAAAPLNQVLAVWQGMGYNRRAKFLKLAAEMVMNEFKGVLPDDPEKLLLLPGIGKATAASIAAFGFNLPTIFIETNVRSVYIHHFFGDREGVGDEEILPLLEQTIDRTHACRWYSALMDYGTELKKRHGNPSRRSRHHATQSKFEGSTRQVRGQVLKVLLDKGAISRARLAGVIGGERKRVDEVVDGLVAEGMVVAEGRKLRVGQ